MNLVNLVNLVNLLDLLDLSALLITPFVRSAELGYPNLLVISKGELLKLFPVII